MQGNADTNTVPKTRNCPRANRWCFRDRSLWRATARSALLRGGGVHVRSVQEYAGTVTSRKAFELEALALDSSCSHARGAVCARMPQAGRWKALVTQHAPTSWTKCTAAFPDEIIM